MPAALWLVAASFVFYGWWNPAFVPLLAISVGANYARRWLHRRADRRPTLQSLVLGLAIAANLAALF